MPEIRDVQFTVRPQDARNIGQHPPLFIYREMMKHHARKNPVEGAVGVGQVVGKPELEVQRDTGPRGFAISDIQHLRVRIQTENGLLPGRIV